MDGPLTVRLWVVSWVLLRAGFTEIDLWMDSRLIFGGISVGFLVGFLVGNFRLIILIWGALSVRGWSRTCSD